MRRKRNQTQLWTFLRHQAELENGGNRQTNPARQPETKIAVRMVSPKQEKQHQQDDERRHFKEGNGEQALIYEHLVPPPGWCVGDFHARGCRLVRKA